MYVDRLYPVNSLIYESMEQMNGRTNSGSFSESDENRRVVALEERKDGEPKRKHRRGRKRNKPKWKPYSKMTDEERKTWEIYEKSRMAQKERKLAAISRRPVAPFNTTQFIMEDRTDSNVYQPRPLEMNSRCMSFDSSTSGEDSFELEDDSFHEQDAFLKADFNQVYTELRMNRLEVMSKQQLVDECFSLEDQLASNQQEKSDLLKQLHELQEQNTVLSEKNTIT